MTACRLAQLYALLTLILSPAAWRSLRRAARLRSLIWTFQRTPRATRHAQQAAGAAKGAGRDIGGVGGDAANSYPVSVTTSVFRWTWAAHARFC